MTTTVDAPATTVFAGAKVNLTLKVTGRRPNGYHDLDSIVVHSTDVGDTVSVRPAAETSLSIAGPFADGLSISDNLVLSAARAMQQRGAPPAAIILDKRLPIASGIGGGSADAAATLHAMNALMPDPLDLASLQNIGAKLGADVPMCVDPRPTRVTGVGDILKPVPLPELNLLLVNPGIAVSTADVFRSLDGFSPTPPPLDIGKLDAWLMATGNDLRVPAKKFAPEIDNVLSVLATLPSARASGLSGSGATCFALFDTRENAEAAATQIAAAHESWWCRAARTRGA
ncbi:MAG: 4-(cytidine 5'-diphospho)-2-C-methyl-D-erythritol kinase [Pseudomonadota bacterium]